MIDPNDTSFYPSEYKPAVRVVLYDDSSAIAVKGNNTVIRKSDTVVDSLSVKLDGSTLYIKTTILETNEAHEFVYCGKFLVFLPSEHLK